MSSPLLTKQVVFSAQDFHFDTVDVKEWGGSLRVRELSGEERSYCDRILKDIEAGKGTHNTYPAAIIACGAVDEQGNAVFTRQDIPTLSRKADAVLQRVAVRILELSGATVEQQRDIEKN